MSADTKVAAGSASPPPAGGVTAPKSARGLAKEDSPPKTTAEEDTAFLKAVAEACTVNTVVRACQALKWHVDSRELVVAALQALAGLALDHPKKQSLIQQKGGITYLIAAMKKYSAPTDAALQVEALQTLIALCDQHDSNANLISKLAIPIVMEQLKTHEKSLEFCAVAVHAMDIVCAAASGRKEAAAKGVAQLVMEVMKAHTASARIQERGSGVLRHIASDATGKQIIAANDGVKFLGELKKLFPNSSVLDENVTEALKRVLAAGPTPPTPQHANAASAAAAAAPAK